MIVVAIIGIRRQSRFRPIRTTWSVPRSRKSFLRRPRAAARSRRRSATRTSPTSAATLALICPIAHDEVRDGRRLRCRRHDHGRLAIAVNLSQLTAGTNTLTLRADDLGCGAGGGDRRRQDGRRLALWPPGRWHHHPPEVPAVFVPRRLPVSGNDCRGASRGESLTGAGPRHGDEGPFRTQPGRPARQRRGVADETISPARLHADRADDRWSRSSSVLAAVALPAYQEYTVRAKVSEIVLAASSCRGTVAEAVSNAHVTDLGNEPAEHLP